MKILIMIVRNNTFNGGDDVINHAINHNVHAAVGMIREKSPIISGLEKRVKLLFLVQFMTLLLAK